MIDPGPALAVGQIFAGHYVVEERLAEGSFSHVYLATRRDTGERVALKVLDAADRADESVLARFRDECLIISSLQHRNTVSLYDYGLHEGRPYLVLEAVAGRSLAERLREGALHLEEAIRVLALILESLGEAHASGVVHRDIKPSNVMLANHPLERHAIKVLDFGTAALRDALGRSGDGGIVGTPLYMAPELTQNAPATAASDLYSLGILAWELVMGRPPFVGESAVETMMMHVSRPVPALHSRLALSPIGEFVAWTTQKDPTVRLADVESARLILSGERRMATLPPPQYFRFSRIPYLPEAETGEGLTRSSRRRVTEAAVQNPLPFVGREHLLAALDNAFRDAQRSRFPKVILLVGAAGMGKSRVARAWLGSLPGGRRLRIYVGRCTPGDPAPCRPLFDALPGGTEDSLPPIRSYTRPPIEALCEPVEVRRASRALWNAASGAPGVLFLEDLHWADEGTLRALGEWFHRARAVHQQLVLVATARVADPTASRHFDTFIGGLLARWPDDVTRIGVPPLPREAIQDLVTSVFSHEISKADVLWELTQGDPLMLAQLYHHFALDRLTRAAPKGDARTTMVRGREVQLPDNLRTLLQRRLTSLSLDAPRVNQLLLHLAVLGLEASEDELRAFLALSDDDDAQLAAAHIGETMEHAVTLGFGLVQETAQGRTLRFSSDVFAHLMRMRLGDVGIWKLLNQRAARLIDDVPNDPVALVRRGRYELESGALVAACETLTRAMDRAQLRGSAVLATPLLDRAHLQAKSARVAPSLLARVQSALADAKLRLGMRGAAADLYRQAIATRERIPIAPALARDYLRYGQLLSLVGDVGGARHAFTRGYHLAAELDDPVQTAESAYLLGRLEHEQGSHDEALQWLDQARVLTDGSPHEELAARIAVAMGECVWSTRRYGEARELIDAALERIRSAGLDGVLASCLRAKAQIEARLGSAIRAEELLEEASELSERHGDAMGHATLLLERGRARFRAGDYGRALTLARQSIFRFAGLGALTQEAPAYAFLVRCLFELGQYEELLAHLKDAVRVCEVAGRPADSAACLHFACRACLALDDQRRALLCARKMQQTVQRQPRLQPLRAAALVDLGLSLRAVDYDEARAVTHQALEEAREAMNPAQEGEAIVLLASLLLVGGELGDLVQRMGSTLDLASRHGDPQVELEARLIAETLSRIDTTKRVPRENDEQIQRCLERGRVSPLRWGRALVRAMRSRGREQAAIDAVEATVARHMAYMRAENLEDADEKVCAEITRPLPHPEPREPARVSSPLGDG